MIYLKCEGFDLTQSYCKVIVTFKIFFRYEDTPENEKSEQDDKQVKSEVKKVK